MKNAASEPTEGEEAFREMVDQQVAKFIEVMDDDLNTADGIAALFDLARGINTFTTQPRSKEALEYGAAKFDELCNVLGLLYNRKGQTLDSEIEALIEKRQQARKEKNFKLADEIRDQLAAQGILLKDTPQGVQWSRKS